MDGQGQPRQPPALVTGGQGFVGSWLVERLAASGAHVVVPVRGVDPQSRFWSEGINERCSVVRSDLLDRDVLTRVIDEHEVATVFHLAAQPIVGVANRSPYGTWESNVRGTYTLLDACRRRLGADGPVERIVVASSDHAYGAQDTLPLREDFPLRGLYPYDVSKTCTDFIARSYARNFDMPVAVSRLANIFGGGDFNWSRIVPHTCRALAAGERPVIRSDGSPERDYLYVEDAVAAYLALARALDDRRHWGRAWNAGHGRGVPVVEIARRTIRAAGSDVEPDVQGRTAPLAEIDRQYLDWSAIREELGWSPQWDLDSALAKTYEWYERRFARSPREAAGSVTEDA